MDQYLGELRIFPFNLIPKGWLPCNGQLLPISSNQALFSLLNTTYGGDGQSTFGLPNLQGRVPVGIGTSPAGVPYLRGQAAGTETVPLLPVNLPSHSHAVNGSTTQVSTGNPGNSVVLGTFQSGQNYYTTTASPTPMNPAAVSGSGAGQAHENRQPLIAMNVCIAIQGIFPSRS